MDRNLIYSAIENPRLRDGISIQELENVREMYPYFTAAQILLAKLYQEKNDHRFADQLQKAAVYALDRKTLYQYITGEREQGTGEQGTGEQGNKEQGNKEQGNKEQGIGEQGTGEQEREQGTGEQGIGEQGTGEQEREQGIGEQGTGEQENKGVGVLVNSLHIHGQDVGEREREQEREQGKGEQGNKEQGIGEQGNKEQGIEEQRNKGTEVLVNSLPIHGQDVGEREREQEREQRTGEQGNKEQGIEEQRNKGTEVLVNSLPIHGQDVGEREREQEQENKEQGTGEQGTDGVLETIHARDLDDMTQNILVEAIQSTIELEVEENEEEEEENENENENEDIEEGGSEELSAFEGEPKTYAEWMMWKAAKQKGDTSKSSKQAVEKDEEATDATMKIAVEKTEVTGPSVTVQKMQVSGPKAHQQNLIDKFIQLQPKITPGRATDYPTKDNLGKDSLEDDMTFVTETMAKLFAQQGKIDKARKVYRQLMVLHPEKSVYFAAQLKNLNQLKK